MGRASQVFGYIFGFIILLIGLGLIIATFVQPLLFLGGFLIIGVLVAIFGFVIMYLGHRSRPKKEKKMLKMQAEEYLEQKMKKEMQKREMEEMEEAQKERKKLEKDMEKAQKEKAEEKKKRE